MFYQIARIIDFEFGKENKLNSIYSSRLCRFQPDIDDRERESEIPVYFNSILFSMVEVLIATFSLCAPN